MRTLQLSMAVHCLRSLLKIFITEAYEKSRQTSNRFKRSSSLSSCFISYCFILCFYFVHIQAKPMAGGEAVLTRAMCCFFPPSRLIRNSMTESLPWLRVGKRKGPSWNAEEGLGETKASSFSLPSSLMLKMRCALPKRRWATSGHSAFSLGFMF